MWLRGGRDRLKSRLGLWSEEQAGSRLQAKYAAFKRLVDANTAALALMADMQSKASGDYLFDRAYVDDSVERLLGLSSAVVGDLGELSDGRSGGLRKAHERVALAVRSTLREAPQPGGGPLVLTLASLCGSPPALAGGKVRRLGEIMTEVGLPVPDGFCITTSACWLVLQQGGLLGSIASQVEALSLRHREELSRASLAIRQEVLDAPWPEAVVRAVTEAFGALEARTGAPLRVSVRSSAVGEDGEFSFAGLFDTALNVDRSSLLGCCREVLASQFTERALVYLKARGASEGILPMAIGVIAMVDARASGVLYTRDPQSPGEDTLTVAGVWGLGGPAVDGSQNPDLFTLSGRPHPVLRETRVGVRDRMLLCGEGHGLVEVDVPSWMRSQPCLKKDHLVLLGTYGSRLEEHFGRPQDVEWVLDARDKILILQSRPLRVASPAAQTGEAMQSRQGLVPLIHQGLVACRGCAAGPVFAMASEEDVRRVPPGAVVVAPSASPRLAEAVDRMAAVVTDHGSPASHLATVAREFGIPAILGTQCATSLLKHGMTVTVDGDMGNVYEGRVEALLAGTRRRETPDESSPLLKRFRASLRHVMPLHLTDPQAPSFRASRCRTVHDLLRFAHEGAVREMFRAGGAASRGARRAVRLESALPVSLFFVDLGGGLRLEEGARTVTPASFLCRPLIPLWEGMSRAPWDTEAAAGAGGMASVLSSSLTARDALREAAEPNLAIVSENYLNLSFRLGYHFSRADAYLTDRAEENYASFVFQGGAADARGRMLRVRLISAVLEASGFTVHAKGEALSARTGQAPPAEMARRLAALGTLMVATRQADTLLRDEAAVARAVAAFQSGDFTLGLGRGGEVAP